MNQNPKSLARRIAVSSLFLIALFTVNAEVVTPANAGVVGGSQSGWSVLAGNDSHSYDLTLRAGQVTWIRVSGDGSSDLDVFLYDEDGNLIESDTDYSDECYVSVTPRWTGSFRIVVRNVGYFANAYSIWTN